MQHGPCVAPGLGEGVTGTTVWLLALMVVTLLLIIGWLLARPASEPHPFVTDPWETEEEHIGRHEMPGGETTALRWPNGTPRRPLD